MKKIFTKKINVALAAMLCCALWGSAFPVIKIGYNFLNIAGSDTSSQILFAGIRFFLAGFFTILLGSIFADFRFYKRILCRAYFLPYFQAGEADNK